GSTFEADKPPEPEQEHPLMRQVRGALGNLEAKGTGGDVGMIGTPTVDEFETISEEEGPDYFANGRFTFENIVNDDILVSEQLTPPDWRPGIKQAVKDNFHLPFFQDNFANESEAYQFLVHMANLESAGGTTFHNDEDALDSGGGSAGPMHLHTTFGMEGSRFGKELNSEGWSVPEVLSDPEKYTTLVMKSLDGNYANTSADASKEALSQTMAKWWTGTDNLTAGDYYLSALSAGKGVEDDTGAGFVQ
ncbi:MAG: hypothetical protein AAFN74_15175, partial [Myxococcota bacterium]